MRDRPDADLSRPDVILSRGEGGGGGGGDPRLGVRRGPALRNHGGLHHGGWGVMGSKGEVLRRSLGACGGFTAGFCQGSFPRWLRKGSLSQVSVVNFLRFR